MVVGIVILPEHPGGQAKDQATFFLDGEKVLSANVSDAKGFRDLNLHLAGTWGKEGSVVSFDNLEVRIPLDQNK